MLLLLIETIVMDVLMSWLNEKKHSHYLTKLNISRNTVSWLFENVVIATTTIVMRDLMTLVK